MNPVVAISQDLFPRLLRAAVPDGSKLRVESRHAHSSDCVVAVPLQEDAGNLIGKHGRFVRSVKLLAAMVTSKHGRRMEVHIDTPMGDNPTPKPRPPISPTVKWDAAWCKSLLQATLDAVTMHPASVTLTETGRHEYVEVLLAAEESKCVEEVAVTVTPLRQDEARRNEVLTGDKALQFALATVFAAIGKQRGRSVMVVLSRRRGVPAPEPQPATAAGRYAEETEVV